MARHTWTYPYEHTDYAKLFNEEMFKYPQFELVEELDVGRGSFCGAGHAWVVRDTANGLTCLQSYGTIVSVVLGGHVRHLGKWTKTTSFHQSRFCCRRFG